MTAAVDEIDDALRTLELTDLPTRSELRTAYRRLAKRFHSDLHPKDSTSQVGAGSRVRLLQEAYDVVRELRLPGDPAGEQRDQARPTRPIIYVVHRSWIQILQLTSGGEELHSIGFQEAARILHLPAGTIDPGVPGWVISKSGPVAYAADERIGAKGTFDGNVWTWRPRPYPDLGSEGEVEIVRRYRTGTWLKAVDLSVGERIVLAADGEGQVWQWDSSDRFMLRRTRWKTKLPETDLWQARMNNEFRQVLVRAKAFAKSLVMFRIDLDSGQVLSSWSGPDHHWNWWDSEEVAISSDLRWVAQGFEDGFVDVYDAHTGACVASLQGWGRISAIHFAGDETLLLGTTGGRVSSWNLRTQRLDWTSRVAGESVTAIAARGRHQAPFVGLRSGFVVEWPGARPDNSGPASVR